ncbi:MAG: hypothetical protein JWO11_3114 [Nocardioides sp.]|nr:hypothetical protein [Nocardioides sp.]
MRTLSVTGLGSAAAVPDAAVLRVAAVHRGANLVDALAGADSGARVIGEVARRHTAPADIATRSLDVWPAHDNKGNPAGFEARHSLTIRCLDLAVAGLLLGELAGEVGNRLAVDGVGTVVTDPSDAQAEARELAFLDARSRAEHLATLAGATLGEVESVVEGSGTPFARFAAQAAGGAAKLDAALEPGQTEISATLTVTWQLA